MMVPKKPIDDINIIKLECLLCDIEEKISSINYNRRTAVFKTQKYDVWRSLLNIELVRLIRKIQFIKTEIVCLYKIHDVLKIQTILDINTTQEQIVEARAFNETLNLIYLSKKIIDRRIFHDLNQTQHQAPPDIRKAEKLTLELANVIDNLISKKCHITGLNDNMTL